MTDSREFLKTEPVGRLILKLSLPAIAAQLINLLYNLVDRIYIGHMGEEGALALTGVGVCSPVILIVAAFAALIGAGGAPRVSVLMGKKETAQAEEIMGQCLSTLVLISLILTMGLLFYAKPLLYLFGVSDRTAGYALKYLTIYAVGTTFVLLTLGMNVFISAQGFAKESMFSVMIGAVLNIVLDPILIFGCHMGVSGAALATIASQGVSCVYVLRFLTGKKTALRIRKKYLRPEAKVMFPCLALGSASFIMQGTESILQICFNSSLLKYGGDLAVGSMTILSSTLQLVMLPVYGLSNGVQPILSYNYGADRMDRVWEAFRTMLKAALSFTAVFCTLAMLFPRVPVAFFTSDPELLGYASGALRTYIAGMTIFGIQISVQCMFTALGKAGSAILVASVRKLILLVPFIYLFPAVLPGLFGLDKAASVFFAEPAADILSVLFASLMFMAVFRKKKDRSRKL